MPGICAIIDMAENSKGERFNGIYRGIACELDARNSGNTDNRTWHLHRIGGKEANKNT